MKNATWIKRETSGLHFFLRLVIALSIISIFPVLSLAQETFQIEEATIASIHAAMKAGKLTCRDLVQKYLDRIEAYDKKGPTINALLEINPEALTIAAGLDEKFSKSGLVGPLHCIPVVLKDNYDTGDKMTTTAGSRAMEGFKAAKDGFLVKKLRDAGALILAKANLDEWAHGGAPGGGYSSRGGQTLNPYKLTRGPLSSSGGPGAAVAANFATVGMGSDTFGSIRYPAAANGLVGLKPTLGLTSRTGIIPFSLNYDVGGPLARTVADLASTLGMLTGVDLKDPVTLESVGKYHQDYTPFLKPNGLKGARVGVSRMFLGKNEDTDKAYKAAIDAMKRMGATLVDPVDFPKEIIDNLRNIYSNTSDLDFKWHLAEYLANAGTKVPVKSVGEVIAISESAAVARSQFPVAPEVISRLKVSETSGTFSDPLYQRTLQAGIPVVRNIILQTLKEKNLDALFFATTPCPAEPIRSVKDPEYKCDGTFRGPQIGLASISGFPEIVVPAGFSADGVPISVSFLAGPYSEPTLISLAYSFEQATKHRRPPGTVPPLK
jgi:amidase